MRSENDSIAIAAFPVDYGASKLELKMDKTDPGY